MGTRGVMCVAYSALHFNRVARFLGHSQQISPQQTISRLHGKSDSIPTTLTHNKTAINSEE